MEEKSKNVKAKNNYTQGYTDATEQYRKANETFKAFVQARLTDIASTLDNAEPHFEKVNRIEVHLEETIQLIEDFIIDKEVKRQYSLRSSFNAPSMSDIEIGDGITVPLSELIRDDF